MHECFDRGLDQLEAALPEVAPTLGQVSETIWALRQQLTGGVAETLVHHTHLEDQHRPYRPCPTCARLLPARGPVHRCVETLVGAVELERPYFYCQVCRTGTYPLDEALDVGAGRLQRDVHQAAVDLATEVPYETASTLFGRLSGITVSSERMHTVTHQVAAGLGVVEVAPSREEIDRRVAQVAAGRCRRPVLVLGIDGALSRRLLRAHGDAARGKRGTAPVGRDGATSGAKPRGFGFTCSMASALCMFSVGISSTMNRKSARPCSRSKTRT